MRSRVVLVYLIILFFGLFFLVKGLVKKQETKRSYETNTSFTFELKEDVNIDSVLVFFNSEINEETFTLTKRDIKEISIYGVEFNLNFKLYKNSEIVKTELVRFNLGEFNKILISSRDSEIIFRYLKK